MVAAAMVARSPQRNRISIKVYPYSIEIDSRWRGDLTSPRPPVPVARVECWLAPAETVQRSRAA
jgi:hypothetical protein